MDVDQLDLVGVDDVDVRDFPSVNGLIGTRLRSAWARSAASSSRVVIVQHLVKSPRFVDRPSCPSAGQFYNVFYMTGQEYDVVVVGSGAAGMVAALTAAHQGLSTVVVEKAPHYGGSTARSGGGVWIPNNEVLKRDGVKRHGRGRPHLPAHDHRRRRPAREDRHLPRARPGDAVVRAEALAAEAVLGARLLRLLPRGAGRQAPAAVRSSRSRSTPRSSAPTRTASSRRTARCR